MHPRPAARRRAAAPRWASCRARGGWRAACRGRARRMEPRPAPWRVAALGCTARTVAPSHRRSWGPPRWPDRGLRSWVSGRIALGRGGVCGDPGDEERERRESRASASQPTEKIVFLVFLVPVVSMVFLPSFLFLVPRSCTRVAVGVPLHAAAHSDHDAAVDGLPEGLAYVPALPGHRLPDVLLLEPGPGGEQGENPPDQLLMAGLLQRAPGGGGGGGPV